MQEVYNKIKTTMPLLLGLVAMDRFRRSVISTDTVTNLQQSVSNLRIRHTRLEQLVELARLENFDHTLSYRAFEAQEYAVRDKIQNYFKSIADNHQRLQTLQHPNAEGKYSYIESLGKEIERTTAQLSVELDSLSAIQQQKFSALNATIKGLTGSNPGNQLLDNF